MSDTVLVCTACAASGFLADKVALFPFALGIALGCSLPVRLIHSVGLRELVARFHKSIFLDAARVSHDDHGGRGVPGEPDAHED